MNIRQIEEQLGIPRANVRYYEKEGLLHPQRGENNYRNYSEEDIETLRKIKLLRQLDMPVETIRAVQNGDVTLEEALSFQSRLLESESTRLEASQNICRSMLTDRVTYAALEPAKYENLRSLPGPAAQKAPEPPKPPVEGAIWAHSPWQRFWARSLDLSLAGCLVTAILSFGLHSSSINTPHENLFSIVETLMIWAVIAMIEPLLLSTWGSTPGKWLMGLELRDHWGQKLTYGTALSRVIGVFYMAYGFEIPLYNFYRYYKSYHTCQDGEDMPYDTEESNLYYSTAGDRWFWRAVISVVLTFVLLAPIQVFLSYQVLVPPNRGDVTQDEFFENVNYMAEQLHVNLTLDEDGKKLEVWGENGGLVTVYGGPASDTPVYTVETDRNGRVTAVLMDESGGGDWAQLPFTELHLALAALQGTEMNGLQLVTSRLWKETSGNDFADELFQKGSVSLQSDGFSLAVTLECEGYSGASYGLLHTPDGLAEPGWYRFAMRIEKD